MSKENIELAQGVFKAGHLNALFDLLDEDVVWDNTRHAPLDLEGVYRGKEAVMQMMKKWVGAWTEYRYELEEMIDAGDSVVLVVSDSGRGVGSGVPMEQHYCQVWTFQTRRIVRGATCKTRAEALEAASVTE